MYAPAATKANTKEERIRFWETLPGLVKGVKEEGDHVCLMGDFNITFPPWLVEMWGHTVAQSNVKRDQKLTKEQEEVATAALTAMTKMDVALSTWQGNLADDYHTYASDNLGENGVRTTIDHMAMTGSLLTQVEGLRAIWPHPEKFKVLRPDHALVVTQLTIYGSERKSRRHHREPPPFASPPDTVLNRLADELRVNMAARMYTEKKREENKMIGVTEGSEHGAMNEEMRTPYPVRKSRNEEAEANAQSHVDVEFRDSERLKEARREDDAAMQVEIALKMMECLKHGDTAGVFKAARGRGLARPSALVSSTGKRGMTNTFRELVGEKHAPRDNPEWDFPEIYKERPPEIRAETWTTLFVDGSFYPDGPHKGKAGFSVVDPDKGNMVCGPVPKAEDGEGSPLAAEIWAVLVSLEKTKGNLTLVGDAETVGKIYGDLDLHGKNDCESLPYARWWRRIVFLTHGRKVKYELVPAHKGDLMNEVADKGAKFAARHMHEELEISFPSGYDEHASWAMTEHNDPCEERFLLDHLMKKQNMFPSRWIPQTPYPQGRQQRITKPPRVDISLEQVIRSINRVKNTSPGEDGIRTAEYRSKEAAMELYELLVKVWADKTVPHQWKRAILLAIPKKAGALTATNCRGITLSNSAPKILMRLILDGSNQPETTMAQFGFVRGKSTVDAIHIARSAIWALKEERRHSMAVFLDIEKAFDYMDRAAVRKVLMGYGFGDTAIALIEDFWDDEVVMRFPDGTYGERFTSQRGVKQGCVISPTIFILCLETVLKDIIAKHKGVVLWEASGTWTTWEPGQDFVRISALAYADDIMILCAGSASCQIMLDEMNAALQTIGIRLSAGKSKVMPLQAEYTGEHDSTEGYNERARKGMFSSANMPNAEPVAVTGAKGDATLHATRHRSDMACACPDCEYVAALELKSPWESMCSHLMSRHEIAVTQVKRYDSVPLALVWEAGQREWNTHETPLTTGPVHITLKDGTREELEVVREFCYLGSILTADGNLDREISARIAKASKAFYGCFPHGFWTNALIPQKSKIAIFDACIAPIMLYASETWAPTEGQVERLEVAYTSMMRIIVSMRTRHLVIEHRDGVMETVFDTPSRERVLRKAEVSKAEDLMRQRRLRLLGALIRHDPLAWATKASRVAACSVHRGHAAKSWHETVAHDMQRIQVQEGTAMDPVKWKATIKAPKMLHASTVRRETEKQEMRKRTREVEE